VSVVGHHRERLGHHRHLHPRPLVHFPRTPRGMTVAYSVAGSQVMRKNHFALFAALLSTVGLCELVRFTPIVVPSLVKLQAFPSADPEVRRVVEPNTPLAWNVLNGIAKIPICRKFVDAPASGETDRGERRTNGSAGNKTLVCGC